MMATHTRGVLRSQNCSECATRTNTVCVVVAVLRCYSAVRPSGRMELRALVLRVNIVRHVNKLVRDRFGDRLVSIQRAHLAQDYSDQRVNGDLCDADGAGNLL